MRLTRLDEMIALLKEKPPTDPLIIAITEAIIELGNRFDGHDIRIEKLQIMNG
jgi:hypothetical protein